MPHHFYSQIPQATLLLDGISEYSKNNVLEIVLSAFSGGLFAGLFSNFFESRRRLSEKRREKYYEHRNTLVQIEHEMMPARLNLSRNLSSIKDVFKSEVNNVRIILRFYQLNLTSGLSLKLLNIDLINEYAELYMIFETINSDIQYLEGIAVTIKSGLEKKPVNVDESLLKTYSMFIKRLEEMCIRADQKSLELLSRIRIIFRKDDKRALKEYMKAGGEITYSIQSKTIKKENERTIKYEKKSYNKKEGPEKFITPYIDLRKG